MGVLFGGVSCSFTEWGIGHGERRGYGAHGPEVLFRSYHWLAPIDAMPLVPEVDAAVVADVTGDVGGVHGPGATLRGSDAQVPASP